MSGVHELTTRAGGAAATPLVKRYAGYREHDPGSERREVAGAGIALVLAFGDPITVRYDGSDVGSAFGAFVVGTHMRPALTSSRGHQQGVEVNLTPAGAFALLGGELEALTDVVTPIDAVLGRDGEELVERLADAPSWTARFELLDHEVGQHREGAAMAREVEWLWHQLAACHGATRVDQLIDETGWSRRHLTRRFRQQIGLPPKACARLLRFEHAVELLGAPGASLASVASEAGYYDQAHLNRDFREFAGCTPTEVRFVQDAMAEAS